MVQKYTQRLVMKTTDLTNICGILTVLVLIKTH